MVWVTSLELFETDSIMLTHSIISPHQDFERTYDVDLDHLECISISKQITWEILK